MPSLIGAPNLGPAREVQGLLVWFAEGCLSLRARRYLEQAGRRAKLSVSELRSFFLTIEQNPGAVSRSRGRAKLRAPCSSTFERWPRHLVNLSALI